MEPLGLYIHIPFCVRKCKYCDFLSAPANEVTMRVYVRALETEIRLRARQMQARAGKRYLVDTVFIGGGTPTALPPDGLSSILYTIREEFDVLPDAEVTCEINPGTVGAEHTGTVPVCSVNRVSIGLQSVHDSELKTLGRIHSFREFQTCYEELRSFGAKNISVDLMFGLPGQTLKSYEESLRTVAELGPEHISAYGLILEEGTPFFAMEVRGDFTGALALPDEETEREMYQSTKRILEGYGYHRYEISNYAKPGFESRHNLRYWQRRPYLGFGLGAASLFDHRRWRNTPSLAAYISTLTETDTETETAGICHSAERRDEESLLKVLEKLEREVEALSEKAEMEEFMFLGLRTSRGISETAFAKAFGTPLETVYGKTLKRLESQGLLRVAEENGARSWSLTDRGVDISNVVLAEFL